ncbi:MAG: D-alanyl-D-alanine carboxypeptidase/D-alanyl-D-alanine-endopeptidase [bacterium]|nr:D-alanyl-D-alanine carboxypeptidase/D-alanyl-D-alanine-endopeptidase [Candidatus Kapabacteria bacterium]
MKRLLPSLLLLLALATNASVFSSHGVALGAGGSATGSVDSLRKGPTTAADSARSLDRLTADLQKLVALPDELKSGRVGIIVRSVTRNRDLYRLNADTPLTPASTTKVVTAYTALCDLGGDYVIRTIVGAANRPTRDAVLVGDVYVKGFGDPFFAASDVDLLVDRFMTSGIKRVEGNVVGDGTYFDEKTRRVEYSGDADQVMPLPPITALTINGNTFTVLISAPSAAGLPLNVQTIPRSSGFEIVSSAVSSAAAKSAPIRKSTRKSSKKKRSDLGPAERFGAPANEFDDEPRYGDEPIRAAILFADASERKRPASKRSVSPATKRAASSSSSQRQKSRNVETVAAAKTPARGLKVSVSTGPDGRQLINVSGSLQASKRASYHYEMKSPAVVIAGMFYDRVVGRGVAITGRTVAAASPTRIKTLAQTERPLMEILSLVMKNSNNFLAEYVFKMIGAHAGARTETARASVQRIGQRMTASGVLFDRCVVNDGSGLSRANVLSATSLAGILSAAHRDRKVFQPFYAAMSVAGVDGTLRKRLKGTLAEGNVHGKTGTLRNVSALTGYVTTRDGELFAFAMLMNGGNHGSYRSVQDKIAQRLAEFSYHAR